jgi:uncharacterized protein CbrC (UPF0167 family)
MAAGSPRWGRLKATTYFGGVAQCAWQTESWFTHCDDGAAFIGAMGCDDLLKVGQEAVGVIRDSTGLDGEDWDEFFAALDHDGSPRAYLFRCLRCGQFGGYTDAD